MPIAPTPPRHRHTRSPRRPSPRSLSLAGVALLVCACASRSPVASAPTVASAPASPVEASDGDGDGVLDHEDACPDVPGRLLDGCPELDTDGDGITDPNDQCYTQPELFNGYHDDDGCPDEIPQALKAFSGGYTLRPSRSPIDRESYVYTPDNPFVAVRDDPVSTFSADVDTASYANVRRFLNAGQLPPPSAVRTEELINYFDYDYPAPKAGERFAIHSEVSSCPWNQAHKLVHIGIKGRVVTPEKVPPRNLVFLVDVSGSMSSSNKLTLLKHGLKRLTQQLGSRDRVSIVVYAGAAGVVLAPTSGREHATISRALDKLEAGGSTAGGEGITLAYALAERSFLKRGINRVILASDGDFNVGVSSVGELTRLVERKRETGVYLTALGFGAGNYNDALMESLADKGNGNYAYIDSRREAEKVLVREAGATLVTIASDVKLQAEFNPQRVQGYRLVGYENRQLADQDFADDRKDAGELGSGHTVTALYEVVPTGAKTPASTLAEKRYQEQASLTKAALSDELMFVKIRSKAPGGSASQERSFAVVDRPVPINRTSGEFRFAAAVAIYGMLLRESPGLGATSYREAYELAKAGIPGDRGGDRQEFASLVVKASQLARRRAGAE